MFHTQFKRGTKLLLILKSGDKLIDKYVESHRNYFILRDSGKVNFKQIRSVSIFREQHARC